MDRLVLPDGASLAYDILGQSRLGKRLPIVLICGLSSRRIDFERLALSLAAVRPVLLFDHRGIGDSTLASPDDSITFDSLARDALYLLEYLNWKSIAICGLSMGGAITQQLLFLPYHSDPTPLPFTVTHVFLAGTFSRVITDRKYGLHFPKPPATLGRPLTEEEKLELSRPLFESSFDPKWIADPANADRIKLLLTRSVQKRPMSTIAKQGRATMSFKFDRSLYTKIPSSTRILIIHGKLDAVVPFYMGENLLQLIPHARFIEVGNAPGQVPSLTFGHQWFEYFDIRIWLDVIEQFLLGVPVPTARL